MKHSSIFFFISIALLCFSKTSSAVTKDEAIQHYKDNNYFEDAAVLEGVKEFLNRYPNDYNLGGTPEDYLNLIYYLHIEGASSLAGMERLTAAMSLKIESSSISDFSPLSGLNIGSLELDNNSYTSIPDFSSLTFLYFVNLDYNLLNLSDETVLADIQKLKDRNIFVNYENQFP